jgi:hypothetical protein
MRISGGALRAAKMTFPENAMTVRRFLVLDEILLAEHSENGLDFQSRSRAINCLLFAETCTDIGMHRQTKRPAQEPAFPWPENSGE